MADAQVSVTPKFNSQAISDFRLKQVRLACEISSIFHFYYYSIDNHNILCAGLQGKKGFMFEDLFLSLLSAVRMSGQVSNNHRC